MLIVVFRGLLRMRSFSLAGWLRTEDIDSGCIKRVFDMSRVEPFDHLNARAAILGDLVNVGTFHKPHADIGMAEAVCSASVAVAIILEVGASENAVEKPDVIAWKDRGVGLWVFHLVRLMKFASFGSSAAGTFALRQSR